MKTNGFRTYELAVRFYRETRLCRLPGHLKNQFDRAASSIALNLNEGWGRSSRPDTEPVLHHRLRKHPRMPSHLAARTQAVHQGPARNA